MDGIALLFATLFAILAVVALIAQLQLFKISRRLELLVLMHQHQLGMNGRDLVRLENQIQEQTKLAWEAAPRQRSIADPPTG